MFIKIGLKEASFLGKKKKTNKHCQFVPQLNKFLFTDTWHDSHLNHMTHQNKTHKHAGISEATTQSPDVFLFCFFFSADSNQSKIMRWTGQNKRSACCYFLWLMSSAIWLKRNKLLVHIHPIVPPMCCMSKLYCP